MDRGKPKLGFTGLLFIPVLLLTLPFFFVGAREEWKVWQDNQDFETAEGEVIHNTLITSPDIEDPTFESSTYHPVISFITADGETKTFTGSGGSYPAKYEIGEKVTILYNPADSSDAEIKSWARWFLPAIFMVIGCLPSLIIGVILLFVRVMGIK